MGGGEGDLKVRAWEDFSMATLTVESIVASFGRKVDGIWRSS